VTKQSLRGKEVALARGEKPWLMFLALEGRGSKVRVKGQPEVRQALRKVC
jgi:hypothetical protein